MKRIKLGIFAILLLTGVFVIIFSCKKEKNEEDDKTQNQTEQSLKDAQLEKMIIAFRDKIDLIRENPTLKSGSDPMEIDEAIWYIEATSNLTYGDAGSNLVEFIIDSSFIDVPLTNGQILWADVQIAYDQVIDSLSVHNAAITASEKQLVVADIAIEEASDNSVTFQINSGFAAEGSLPGNNDHPWYWGWELGRCDGTGIGVGFDAADKIAELANLLISVPSGNSYYTDIEWEESTGCEHASGPDDCLFEDFQEYTLVHQCLSPANISFYKSNLIVLGDSLNPSTEHSVIHYLLEDWTAFALCGPDNHDCWYMSHHADIKYGIWHTSSEPPAEL